jgi:hypothetical protein
VEVVHAVLQEHGRRVLARAAAAAAVHAARAKLEGAEERVVARARHVVPIVARHDRVAARGQHEQLRDHGAECAAPRAARAERKGGFVCC